ncbi:hypothetical protein [Larkinella knui]|uniref:Uncharacterized protein n=1 Tax=Larkinella knui TaxID=2025310 RepID=A0A3P1CKQ6_9BACT|nr:hypothetical protein [Larkinella knui]RRB13913.1 hypothetical protein EHT87_16805 [Larkinella knui]
MKYSVSYNIDQSTFELKADDNAPISFNNHIAVIEYLEKEGLSEPEGDYVYDPVQKRFLFSPVFALDQPA